MRTKALPMLQFVVLLAARLKKQRWAEAAATAEVKEVVEAAIMPAHAKCTMQPAVTVARLVKFRFNRGWTRTANPLNQFIATIAIVQ